MSFACDYQLETFIIYICSIWHIDIFHDSCTNKIPIFIFNEFDVCRYKISSHDDLETQRRPIRGQFTGHVTSGDQLEAMSGGEVIEGFLCPLCMKDLGDVIQLQVSNDTLLSFAFTFQKASPKTLLHLSLVYHCILLTKFNLYSC